MPSLRLDELAKTLDARLEGDAAVTVERVDTLADAGAASLSFFANPKYESQLAATAAAAVLVPEKFERPANAAGFALLRAANPDLAFSRATRLLNPPPATAPEGVHPTAVISPQAVLEDGVAVGPYAVVEAGARVGAGTALYAHVYVGHGAVIGRDCQLHHRATLYHHVSLGDRVVMMAGAVVGADGFGYLWNGQALEKSPHIGTVVVEDDVEIGANATVDRARFGETRLMRGAKLDNLVHIAHNVRIGRHCAFAAQVGVAGSSSVGDGVMMGGQVGVGGHIHVGDGAAIAGQAGLSRDVPPGAVMIDTPARTRKEFLEERHQYMALGRLRRMVEALAKKTGLKRSDWAGAKQ